MEIRCVVCGEPWDACGVSAGDSMAPWEANLFRQGSGCPACEGHPPFGGQWQPNRISDVENGDGDPALRIAAHERFAAGRVPRWERPAAPVHWICAQCGVQVITDQDSNELEYHLPVGAAGNKWYHSHPYQHGCPDKEPAHTFGADTPQAAAVCEFCLRNCAVCAAKLCPSVADGDPYSPGWGGHVEGLDHYEIACVSCIESYCADCCQFGDDCECGAEK